MICSGAMVSDWIMAHVLLHFLTRPFFGIRKIVLVTILGKRLSLSCWLKPNRCLLSIFWSWLSLILIFRHSSGIGPILKDWRHLILKSEWWAKISHILLEITVWYSRLSKCSRWLGSCLVKLDGVIEDIKVLLGVSDVLALFQLLEALWAWLKN